MFVSKKAAENRPRANIFYRDHNHKTQGARRKINKKQKAKKKKEQRKN